MQVRVAEIVSTLEYLDEDTIILALNHRVITLYAYILHDKCTFTQAMADEKLKKLERDCRYQSDPKIIESIQKNMDQVKEKVGTEIDPHWHVVIYAPNKVDITRLSKWFGVPTNFIEIPKGRGAFLDKVQYLTHEGEKQQALGKHLYSDEEVHANFDWRAELNEREAEKLRFGKSLSNRDKVRSKVLYEGLSLREAEVIYPIEYMNDLPYLQKLRMQYIQHLDPPEHRDNFYICGKGGYGKGVLSRGLARCLYPDIKDDREIFFEVGAKGVPFEGYDGQPVLIWNDYRSGDLFRALGDRGNVFNVFDTHPTRQRQNVKYASANLANAYNIVNSVQPYPEFLNSLAGEYMSYKEEKEAEDLVQAYRRFDYIFHLVSPDEIEVIVYNSLLTASNNSDEARNYMRYCSIATNLRAIAQNYSKDREKLVEVQTKTFQPILRLIGDCQRIEEDKIEEKPFYVDYSNQKVFDMSTAQMLDSDGNSSVPNWVQEFVDMCCIVSEERNVRAMDMQKGYANYCRLTKKKQHSARDLSNALSCYPEIERKKTKEGYCYFGITLQSPIE